MAGVASALWDPVRHGPGWGAGGSPGTLCWQMGLFGCLWCSEGHPAPLTLLMESSGFGAAAPKEGNGWDMLLAFVWACAPQAAILRLFRTQYLM